MPNALYVAHNFMLGDLAGSLWATLAFCAVLYAPGYVVAYAADVFGFRGAGFVKRAVWAVACSFAVSPVLAYLVGRISGLRGVCWLFAAASLATLILLLRPGVGHPWRNSGRRSTFLLLAGWAAFVLLMVVDAQVGHKLYFSVVMADQSYRIAFTDAVVRTGIPPVNPLYFAGSAAPMRYYYFWYVLCAAVVKLAHVTSREAFIASSVWAGFGLLATMKLYATDFFQWGRRQTWIAMVLLGVTGIDILPSLGNVVLQPALNGDIEWWSVDPIDAWPDSLLWVPHHAASVFCCLLAFLFLWKAGQPGARTSRTTAVVLAAFACCSAFGLSVYVAIGFALLLAAWVVRQAVQRDADRFGWWRRIAAMAVLSGLLLAPFLLELRRSTNRIAQTDGGAASTHVFNLSVRPMIDSGLLTGLPVFAKWNAAHPVLLDQAIRLLLLLPGLAMELGLYGAILLLLLWARRRGGSTKTEPAHAAALFFSVTGLVMTMFISSSVISNNDFGYRAVMLPQFFLTLLAADVLGSWWIADRTPLVPRTPGNRRLLYILLALGVASSAYGAVLLRAWLPLETLRPRNGFAQLPDDAFQVRATFEQLRRIAAPGAVVSFRQIEPDADRQDQEVMTPNEFFQRSLVMNAGRQMLNAERKCASHFGGDPTQCAAIRHGSDVLFSMPAPSAAVAQAYCERFGLQYLLVSHRDAVWADGAGWPATLPVLASEAGVKIVQCSSMAGSDR